MFKFFKKTTQKDSNSSGASSNTINIIIDIIPDINAKDITPGTRLEDLGIDSIKFMNLVISFEEILGRDMEDFIDEIDITKIQTIQDVDNLLISLK